MRSDWFFLGNSYRDGPTPMLSTESHLSQGNSVFQEAVSCLHKFAGAFFIWLSGASNADNNQRVLRTSGLDSVVYESRVKHISSYIQTVVGMNLNAYITEEHAFHLFLARFFNSTIGKLRNELQQNHANLLSLAIGFVPPHQILNVVPPFNDVHANEFVGTSYQENNNKRASVTASTMLLPQNATELKTGIKLPTFLEAGSNLTAEVLVGMGSKTMKILRIKSLKVYAFGVYIQPDLACKKLGPKYASVPAAELKNHSSFYDDLMREDINMTVRLVVNCNGLNINTVRDVFEKSLRIRLRKINPNTDYHCLKTFGSHFSPDIRIPMGTTIDFRRTADWKLVTEGDAQIYYPQTCLTNELPSSQARLKLVDGKLIGAVDSKDLCKAFFDMYIGDPPVSVEAKQDVAENVASLIRRC